MIGAISTGLRAYCRSPSQTGRAIVPPCWASAAPCPRDAPGRPASCTAWRRPLPAAFDGQTHRLSWLLCVPLPLAPPPETHAHTPHAHAARAFTPMQGAAGATTAPHGRVPRASLRQARSGRIRRFPSACTAGLCLHAMPACGCVVAARLRRGPRVESASLCAEGCALASVLCTVNSV